ncbi:MAG: PD40 domain-containing protein [Thermoleophilia bacterium]|nr:PD40 domain-containing protein [Thermoleophilia bacterium]
MALLACLQVAPALAAEPAEKGRIAYVNGTQIFAINADGSDRRPLTYHSKSLGEYDEEWDGAPRVSPDGKRFLFLREGDYDEDGEVLKLMVASMDGSKAQTVTTSNRLESRKRLGPQFWFKSAAWSQDGQRIIFTQDESLMSSRKTRWVSKVRSIRPDGSGLKTIVTARSKRTRKKRYQRDDGLFADIDTSPVDGRLLVTRELLKGEGSDLLVVDPDTGKAKRVVRAAEQGRWSPDGKSILFLSDRDRTGEQCEESSCEFQSKLYTAEADGSGQRKVRPGHQSGTIVGADWSPDGSRIAFGSDRNFPAPYGVAFEIYSVEPSGDCLTWLTNGSPASADPNWSPVAGTDSSPGACGATDRPALVEPLPSLHPVIDGKQASWPRLWLGPEYRGKILTFPTADGEELAYYDCGKFRLSDCPIDFADLESDEACGYDFNALLEDGRYTGLMRHRGALVALPHFDGSGNREVTLISGGQTIGIYVEDSRFRKRTTLSEYLAVVDLLRPVGRDDLVRADLQEAVFGRGDVRKAAAITDSFEQSKSVLKVSKRFHTKTKVIRAYLKFQTDIDKFGPIKTVKCQGSSL